MPAKKSNTNSNNNSPKETESAGGSFLNTLFRNIKKDQDDAVREGIKKQYKLGDHHSQHAHATAPSSASSSSIPKEVKDSLAALLHPESNQPLVFNAVRCGSENSLQVLIHEFGVSPDALPARFCAKDKNSQPITFAPPFLEAARLDDDALVRFFIEKTEANLTAVDEKTGQNVFHVMAQSGSSALFDYLLEEVEEKRFNLHCCHDNAEETKQMKRHFVTGKALLLLSQDASGDTPLHLFVSSNSPSMLQGSMTYLESLMKKHKEDFSNVELLKKDVFDVLTTANNFNGEGEGNGTKNNRSRKHNNKSRSGNGVSALIPLLLEDNSLTSTKTLQVLEIAVSQFGLDAFSSVSLPVDEDDDDEQEENDDKSQNDSSKSDGVLVPLLYRLILTVSEEDAKSGNLVPVIRTLFSNDKKFKAIPNLNAPNVDPVKKAFRVLMSLSSIKTAITTEEINPRKSQKKLRSIFELALREPVSVATFKMMLSYDLSDIYNDENASIAPFDECSQLLQESFFKAVEKQLAPDEYHERSGREGEDSGKENDEEDPLEVDTYFSSESEANQFVASLENCLNTVFAKFEIVPMDFVKAFSQKAAILLKSFGKKLAVLEEERRKAEEEENRKANSQVAVLRSQGDYSGTSCVDAVERARMAAEKVQQSRLDKIKTRRAAEASAEEEDTSHLSQEEKLLQAKFGNKKKLLIKSSGNDIFGRGGGKKDVDLDDAEEKQEDEVAATSEASNKNSSSSPTALLKNESGKSISAAGSNDEKSNSGNGLSLAEKIVIVMILLAFVFVFVKLI